MSFPLTGTAMELLSLPHLVLLQGNFKLRLKLGR